MTGKVLGIVGSRVYPNPLTVLRGLELGDCVRIVTGGATGVDAAAERLARERGIPCEVIRPLDSSDKFSYFLRNVEIITKADEIVAVWNGKSRGTAFVIEYAKRRGKPVRVIR